MEKSLTAFESLGYTPVSLCGQEGVVYDEYRQCDIGFMERPGGDVYIELIAPRSPESPIWGLMSSYKNAPYHLCFESENLNADVQNLQGAGWSVFQSTAPAPAINGRPVVFLVHRSAGIIELVGEFFERDQDEVHV